MSVFWLEGWRFGVLVTDTSFTAPTVGEKFLQALAKHSAFEKLPLARNQQGAVKNLVAKSSEDPDHMGCTLFQSIRRWAGFFPYVLLWALFLRADSEQGTLCRVTVFFFLRLWGRGGESWQPKTPGEGGQERKRGVSKSFLWDRMGLGALWTGTISIAEMKMGYGK